MNTIAIRFIVFLMLTSIAGCAPSTPRHAATPTSSPASPPTPAPTESDATRSSKSKRPASQSLDELLLFAPSRYPEGDWKPEGLNFEDAWFHAEDGTRLHGWYCPCPRSRAVLLYAHGNAGNLSHRGPRLKFLQRTLHVTVFIFDYRGYGRSEGTPTVAGILQDARAARRFLAKRVKCPESQIVLLGRSLGGAVAVQLAAESSARGLILESTFSSLKDVASYHFPRLAWLIPSGKFDSVARIPRFKGPLLQSHGEADRTIPYSQGWKLFQAANEPKQFIRIPKGDHNDPPPPEYNGQLDRFLRDLSIKSGNHEPHE